MGFDHLWTCEFSRRMRPHADTIYQGLWPGSTIERLEGGHPLDVQAGIDGFIGLPSAGARLSIQEKFRDCSAMKYGDVTFEVLNGTGADGEWAHAYSQLHFYGWASPDERGFLKWVLFDTLRLKLEVDRQGGFEKIGTLRTNNNGGAKFYAVPIYLLSAAILASRGVLADAA